MTDAAHAAVLDLVDLDIEGINGWVRREDAAALDAARIVPSVRLLPMFDPWVNELPRQVDWMLPVDRHDAVHRAAGWVSAVVLIDGRIAGTWEIEAGKRARARSRSSRSSHGAAAPGSSSRRRWTGSPPTWIARSKRRSRQAELRTFAPRPRPRQ